jgi:hypothetical protein
MFLLRDGCHRKKISNSSRTSEMVFNTTPACGHGKDRRVDALVNLLGRV